MIYFIRCGLPGDGGPVKIGFAGSPGDCERRREALQTGNHVELFLVAVMGGGYDREAELHERFKVGWIRGEWFRADTPGLKGLITVAIHEEALIEAGAAYCDQCGIRVVQPPRRKLCSAECERQKKITTSRAWKKRRALGLIADLPLVDDDAVALEEALLQAISRG